MRKFTTIASALMLGCFGFMANAAESTETATVNPAPGLVGPYDLPSNITVNWANNTLTFVEGSELSLPMTIDGVENKQDATATVSGSDLNINLNGAWINESVSLTVPAGVLYFNGSDVTNPELELTYVAAPMEDGYVVSPANQSNHFSISEVTITAGNFTLAVNKDTQETIKYGTYAMDWDTFQATWSNEGTLNASNVTANSDGSVTIQLPKAFAYVGTLRFEVPQGFFTVSNDLGSILAEGFNFAYNIENYQTFPENYGLVVGPLSNNIYVYASQSIEFNGNADQVTLLLNKNSETEEATIEAGSVTTTTYNGYPAIQIALSEPLNPAITTEVEVTVPANLLKVNGNYLTNDVVWDFSVAAGPTAEPYNGWYGTALEGASFVWGQYPLTLSTEVYPTVTYGENVVNVADYATLEEREGENGQGMPITYQALTFNFDEAGFNETADYVLTIPAGYVNIEYSDDNVLPCSEYSVTYHVIAPVAYTLDPADGAEVDALSNLTLTFDAANVGIYTDDQMVGTLVNASTDEELYTAYASINRNGENGEKSFNIYFVDPNAEVAEGEVAQEVTVTAPGYYMVRLSNFFLAVVEDGEEVAALSQPMISATYTVVPSADYVTFDPASGSQVDAINQIVVTFAEQVGYIENTTPAVAVLENTTTGESWYCATPIMNTKYEGGLGRQYTLSFTELNGEEAVEITEMGNYVLSLKGWYNEAQESETEDGLETTDHNMLPTMTASYSIVDNDFVTYEPAPEETLTEINQITVTFAQNVGWDSSVRPGAAVLENLSTGTTYYCYAPFKQTKAETEGAVYVLDFYEMGGEEPVTIGEMGYYALSLHGVYASDYEDEDGDMVYNYLPVFTTYYSVVPTDFFTLDPEAGTTVSDLSTINIEFNGQVGFIPGVRPAAAILENTTTGTLYYCENPMRNTFAESEGSVYTLKFTELGGEEEVEVTEAGNYILRINGAYIGEPIEDEDGEMIYKQLPVITVTYSVYPEDYYTITPASGSEVDVISMVTLTFNGKSNVGIAPLRPAPVVLTNLTTGDVWYCSEPMQQRLDDGSKQFTFAFSELGGEEVDININGEYSLVVKGIYESVINEDESETDTDLPNIEATYYIVNGVTGIESVLEADTYTVYGINGILMVKDGKASDVNALNPGLYIINGKKVIIRK